jgi:hypothetical protein
VGCEQVEGAHCQARLMDTPSSGQLDALGRARYKLRQAELALSYLRQVPAEIALDLRRGRAVSDPDLRLDTFFFSCLGLCKSAFNIIRDGQGGHYKGAIGRWRDSILDDAGRAQFDRMMKLRDKDVHQGQSDGKTLAAMIPIERSYDDNMWMHQQQPNYAALGISRPVTEHKNPDGGTISSYEGLQGSVCLYIEIAGKTWEASNACERFIAQLSQLIDSVGAANGPTPGPLESGIDLNPPT